MTRLASGWLSVLLLATSALSANVTLPYGTLVGHDNYINDFGVALPTPLVAYLNIPYAAPPTGQRRFAYPVAPLETNGIVSSTEYGPVCPQPGAGKMDEDCLSLAVFAPKGTKESDKLPVVIWFHGGAFNADSKRHINLPSMVSHAPVKYVGVGINFRLGALGFLPSNLTQKAGLLNLGLYDQVYAMDWVQKYIRLFGGDPDQVTLYGQSSGGTSIGYHMFHVESLPKFKRIILDSGGPTTRSRRSIPKWDYPLLQEQMTEFLNLTGCSRGDDEVATFSCLRTLPQDTIKNASVSMYIKYRWVMLGTLNLAQPAHISWEEGRFHKMPIMVGFTTNEANALVPQNLNTTDEFLAYIKTPLPLLSDSQLAEVAKLYPAPDIPGSPYANSPLSPQFSRLAAAWGDLAYIAQAQATAIYASTLDVPVWKFHFNHLTPGFETWVGVNHTSELPFVSGEWAAKYTGEVAAQSKLMNAHWSSFIVSGDPNKHMPSTAPIWPQYLIKNQTQLRLSNGSAFVEPDDIRRNATDFWRSIPDVLMH